MQVPDLLLHIETCCMTILAKAAHTAAKAEVCKLHDMCPLGLRNELNVKSPSRVRLQLVSQDAKFGSRVWACAAAVVCGVRGAQQIAVMSDCTFVDVDRHKQRVTRQRNSS